MKCGGGTCAGGPIGPDEPARSSGPRPAGHVQPARSSRPGPAGQISNGHSSVRRWVRASPATLCPGWPGPAAGLPGVGPTGRPVRRSTRAAGGRGGGGEGGGAGAHSAAGAGERPVPGERPGSPALPVPPVLRVTLGQHRLPVGRRSPPGSGKVAPGSDGSYSSCCWRLFRLLPSAAGRHKRSG